MAKAKKMSVSPSWLRKVFDEASPLNATDAVPHLSEDTCLPLERYERQYLCQMLERTGGNKVEAARLLNISRRTLYRKLTDYDL